MWMNHEDYGDPFLSSNLCTKSPPLAPLLQTLPLAEAGVISSPLPPPPLFRRLGTGDARRGGQARFCLPDQVEGGEG